VAELSEVHSEEHIALVARFCETGEGITNADLYRSDGSHTAALLAAGCCVEAALAVCSGTVSSAFALVRPPGHHAGCRAEGFCFFNSVAVAARAAQRSGGVSRVAIVDWDGHHGNGTSDTG
jgi:acetoin utilization deacetylase AcuC-like enzyme